MRSEQFLLARRQVDQEKIAIPAALHALDDRAPAVVAEIGHGAEAGVDGYEPGLARRGVIDVAVEPTGVFGIGAETEEPAAPSREPVVDLPSRGDEPGLPAVRSDEIDLLVQAAPRSDREGQPFAVRRPVDGAHLVFEPGDLPRLSPFPGHRPHLRHASPVGDERDRLAIRREGRGPAGADPGHPRHSGLKFVRSRLRLRPGGKGRKGEQQERRKDSSRSHGVSSEEGNRTGRSGNCADVPLPPGGPALTAASPRSSPSGTWPGSPRPSPSTPGGRGRPCGSGPWRRCRRSGWRSRRSSRSRRGRRWR